VLIAVALSGCCDGIRQEGTWCTSPDGMIVAYYSRWLGWAEGGGAGIIVYFRRADALVESLRVVVGSVMQSHMAGIYLIGQIYQLVRHLVTAQDPSGALTPDSLRQTLALCTDSQSIATLKSKFVSRGGRIDQFFAADAPMSAAIFVVQAPAPLPMQGAPTPAYMPPSVMPAPAPAPYYGGAAAAPVMGAPQAAYTPMPVAMPVAAGPSPSPVAGPVVRPAGFCSQCGQPINGPFCSGCGRKF
jgi:hypothetical protein